MYMYFDKLRFLENGTISYTLLINTIYLSRSTKVAEVTVFMKHMDTIGDPIAQYAQSQVLNARKLGSEVQILLKKFN